MAETAKPLRADAARNRELVLETAYATFAAEGLSVPIDEIARRAGVGAGTVYRHFPTKNALFSAVIQHRLQQVATAGRTLLDTGEPGAALFGFIRAMAVDWAAADQGLNQVIAGDGIDLDRIAPDAEAQFLALPGRTEPHPRCRRTRHRPHPRRAPAQPQHRAS